MCEAFIFIDFGGKAESYSKMPTKIIFKLGWYLILYNPQKAGAHSSRDLDKKEKNEIVCSHAFKKKTRKLPLYIIQ